MWGESSENCEHGCQCEGLITDSFKINSGNNATKRKQEESVSTNFKFKMNPHSLDFKSPLNSPIISKRRILGEISNSLTNTPKRRTLGDIMNMDSPRNSPLQRLKLEDRKSPLTEQTPIQRLLTECRKSPAIDRGIQSPVTSRSMKRTTKITRIFEERSKFKSNKENVSLLCNETFVRLDLEEEARDSFGGFRSHETVTNWSMTKLDFSDAIPSSSKNFTDETKNQNETEKDFNVPEKDMEILDQDFETLHDLEDEFDNENFETCTKYEIISTDSPNIISRGRSSTSRKVNAKDFVFGAPLADNEQSTSFNKPNVSATRMLNFEDQSFEFTSPAAKKTTSFSVKKSLKFNESPAKGVLKFETPPKSQNNLTGTNTNFTPTRNPLRHEKSDSSIGSMFSSPSSSHLRLFTSESTASMESGFISEFEEPFLELEEPSSNSPKLPNFNDLLSGQIRENIITNKNFLRRPALQRSLSFNPDTKTSLFNENSIERKPQKRPEPTLGNVSNKKRKSNLSPLKDKEKSNFSTDSALNFSPLKIMEKSTLSPLKNMEKCSVSPAKRPTFQRAFSENHATIMSALARSSTDPDLIGDFSVPYALPLTGGDHSDLKSISADTLAALIRGDYSTTIHEFKVIDCRYPYEFEGGHIPGALNLYTPALMQQLLNSPLQPPAAGRSVLVLHCEFSRERGPKLLKRDGNRKRDEIL